MVTPWYAVVAICVSTLALFIAAKNYRRKAGLFIRGAFSIASSRDCDDQYVSIVILENLKDRAITVFSIYLRVGHNYYIELENLEDRPLLLKAYETYQKNYGPLQFYEINCRQMNLNSLLGNTKVNKRLVLSTSEGKYVVPSSIRRWSPIGDFFRNHMTAVVRPVRTSYKEKHVGGNIKYVVEFIGENGQAEIIPIHPEDFRLKIFRNFPLTPSSLESTESLKAYLTEQMNSGKLVCRSFNVHDVAAWKERAAEIYHGPTIQATAIGFLYYHVGGRLFTWFSDRKLRKENAKRQHGAKAGRKGPGSEVSPRLMRRKPWRA